MRYHSTSLPSFVKKFKIIFVLSLVFTSCKTNNVPNSKTYSHNFKSTISENYFTGLLVVDPATRDTLYSENAHRYFTPASNTKIFTLYTALQVLPNKIPALKYSIKNGTTYIEGTGDPTLLHSFFKNSSTLDFLKQQNEIVLNLSNFDENKLAPGWSWDDYQYYYQPERGSLPIYGNVATVTTKPNKEVTPSYFTDSVTYIKNTVQRETNKNLFYASPKRDTVEIPFKSYDVLTKILLEQATGKKVTLTTTPITTDKSILYSVPTDSVLNRMMEVSDNFLAEQLMILASSTLSDTLSFKKASNYTLDVLLADLKEKPRWVDGSGLSRYNLFTPASMVHVLHKMYTTIDQKRLFGFFPKGGETGTLEKWYAGAPETYVFAKTGTLSNNHCLSGYLKAKSGKILIFSYMNNHFMEGSTAIKENMQKVLETIRDNN